MNVSKINPCSFSENPKKIYWKSYGIFLGDKHPQNEEERKALSQATTLFPSKNGRKFDFK